MCEILINKISTLDIRADIRDFNISNCKYNLLQKYRHDFKITSIEISDLGMNGNV